MATLISQKSTRIYISCYKSNSIIYNYENRERENMGEWGKEIILKRGEGGKEDNFENLWSSRIV